MAKVVSRAEITENDIFKNARDSALSTIKVVKKLDESFKKTAATLKGDIANAKFGNTAEIEKFVAATQKAQKLQKESLQLKKTNKQATDQLNAANKNLARTKAEEMKTERELLKETRLLNTEKERGKKVTERQTKAIKDENSEYKKLVVSTRKQKNESKELAAQMLKLQNAGRGNSETFKKLERNYNKVTAAARKGDKALKKIDGTVGDNFRNVGNYTKGVRGLSNVLGKLGIAFGIGAIVRNTFNTIKDFEQGQADLAAVLASATVPQLKSLENQAKSLGATTTFTAAEVAGLQKEFAKLGFDPSEIKNVTEATLLLAEATGTELARAAEVAGATIRGFGLDTTDTGRVVDVMAASFSKSSLDMEKFATAMSSVAPVANQFGFGVEKTTALLGTLTDRGIDASSAGTGLRNMFLDSNKAGLTFQEALEKVNNASDKTAASFDLFGKRGATLGVILAENQEATAKLTEELLDSDKAAEKMAKTQRETLGGALKLLASAWDGFILSMNEAGGVGEKLRAGIVFLADNFQTIVKWVGIAVKAFLLYKATLLSIKLFDFIKGLGGMKQALKGVNDGLKNGGKSAGGFGKSLRAIGWATVIALALELANTFIDIATGADVAAQQLKVFRDINARSTDATNANINAIEKQINAEKKRLELLVAGGDLTEKQANAELQLFLNRKKFKGVIVDYKTGLETQIEENLFDEVDTLIKAQERTIKIGEGTIRSLKQNGEFKNRLKIASEKGVIDNAKEQIENLRAFKVELENQNFQLTVNAKEFEKFGRNKVEILDVDILKKQNDELKRTIDLMNAIRGLERKEEADELTQLNKPFLEEVKKQEFSASNSGTFELDELTKQINNIEDIRIQQADDDAEFRKEVARLEITDANLLKIELETIELEHQIKLREIKDETQQIREDTIDSLMSKQTEYEQSLETVDDKTAEQLQKQLDHLKRLGEIAQAITDVYIMAADRRIAKIDEEIDAAEKQRTRFQELADAGNIKANESLAEQNRIIADANRKKEREEKRKRTAELINAAVQTYTAKAADPTVKHPLLETIKDITLLTAFISNMPAFLDGTEDTGTNGRGIDGKGGFNAILHPRERVVPKGINSQLGGVKNEDLPDLVRIAQQYETGKLMSGGVAAVQIGGAWEQTAVIEQLKSLEQTVKGNEMAFGVEQTLKDGFQWFTKTKDGNTTNYNRYKVKN